MARAAGPPRRQAPRQRRAAADRLPPMPPHCPRLRPSRLSTAPRQRPMGHLSPDQVIAGRNKRASLWQSGGSTGIAPIASRNQEEPSMSQASGEPEGGEPEGGEPEGGGRAQLAGLDFDRLTETQVVERIIEASRLGQGGWVVTPNIDICRMAGRHPAMRRLLAEASLVVPDGVPLLWAARLRGEPLTERVAGSSLIFSLTEAAARHGRSIYLLGGRPGIPEQAGQELCRLYPELKVGGTDAPPVGFDTDPQSIAAVYERLAAAAPGIVYVGLGFPKQERLITSFAPSFPGTWFVGCGAAIPFAAKALPRAPQWMQRAGLEWMFRL